MIILYRNLVIRIKPILGNIAIITTIITLHPDLLKKDVKSLVILVCFIYNAFNDKVISKYQERP